MLTFWRYICEYTTSKRILFTVLAVCEYIRSEQLTFLSHEAK